MQKRNTLKRMALIFLTVLLAVGMTACTDKSKEPEKKAKKAKPKKQVEEMSTKKAMEAYKGVLETNKDRITSYSWQREVNDNYELINRQVAFCDINGDQIPELFFFTAEDPVQATMHIYTYYDGQAQEINYQQTYDQDGRTMERLRDMEVAAGVSYVVYMNKSTGDLMMYSTHGDESITYVLNDYKITKTEGAPGISLKESDVLVNEVGPNEDYTGTSDIYYRNGTVMNSGGGPAFTKGFSECGSVILYSGHDQNSIWKNFNTADALGMSYEEAMTHIANQIG